MCVRGCVLECVLEGVSKSRKFVNGCVSENVCDTKGLLMGVLESIRMR